MHSRTKNRGQGMKANPDEAENWRDETHLAAKQVRSGQGIFTHKPIKPVKKVAVRQRLVSPDPGFAQNFLPEIAERFAGILIGQIVDFLNLPGEKSAP